MVMLQHAHAPLPSCVRCRSCEGGLHAWIATHRAGKLPALLPPSSVCPARIWLVCAPWICDPLLGQRAHRLRPDALVPSGLRAADASTEHNIDRQEGLQGGVKPFMAMQLDSF